MVWGARGCTNTTLANRQPETRQPIVFPPLGKCQSGPGNRTRRSELWGAAEWAGVGRLDSRSAENAETGRFLKRCGGSRTRADERAGGPHPHLQNPTSKTPSPSRSSEPQSRAALGCAHHRPGSAACPGSSRLPGQAMWGTRRRCQRTRAQRRGQGLGLSLSPRFGERTARGLLLGLFLVFGVGGPFRSHASVNTAGRHHLVANLFENVGVFLEEDAGLVSPLPQFDIAVR